MIAQYKNARMLLIAVLGVFIAMPVKAEIVELTIAGYWSAGDFKVTESSNASYDQGNPQFDGKVFGVTPSSGTLTLQLRVNTDGGKFFPQGSTFSAAVRGNYALAHDFYGYQDVSLVGGSYRFGSATWENKGILPALEGPDNTKAALWTDADITKGNPTRLSFRMFGIKDGVHPDLFVGPRTHERIGNGFVVWEYYMGEEIRSPKYTVKSKVVSGSVVIP